MSAPAKILHVADVHLDRPFVGLTLDDARARRRELREALGRCLDVALAHAVDVITIGGDLWEDEHVTPDTCRWVADRLESTGLPVVIVAGNHDPLRPGGPHQRVSWPTNVRVLPAGPDLTRHELDGVSVRGMSWGTVPLTADTLRTFSVPDDGASNVLVLHGTAGGAAFNDGAHCPFTAAAVRNAGFELCLAGHLHAGGVRDDVVVYPGSPEPLAWDETGRHAVALVEFNVGTSPRAQLLDVNTRRYAQTVVDCDGAHSSADVERALSDAVSIAAADIGILDQLEIPYFALFDADAASQNPSEAVLNRRLLDLCGEQPADWPERTVRGTSANFENTMESDLAVLWPAFAQARQDVAGELGIKADKKPRVYRDAVARAGEPPTFLLDVLDAARKLP